MIKVNKEIGKRLEFMINNSYYTKESILHQHIEGWSASKNECLNELKLSELAECLLVGFEVEETTEDKILENYKDIEDMYIPIGDEYRKGFKIGYISATKSILKEYNIKIEGINA